MNLDYSKPYLKWIPVQEFLETSFDPKKGYFFRDYTGETHFGHYLESGFYGPNWYEWQGLEVNWDNTVKEVTHVAIPYDKPDYLTCMLSVTDGNLVDYLSIEIFGKNGRKLTITTNKVYILVSHNEKIQEMQEEFCRDFDGHDVRYINQLIEWINGRITLLKRMFE
jgi:hypothetical protein